jgi:hypothetical protein
MALMRVCRLCRVLWSYFTKRPSGAEAQFIFLRVCAALKSRSLFHGAAGGGGAPHRQQVPPLRIAFLRKATLRSG